MANQFKMINKNTVTSETLIYTPDSVTTVILGLILANTTTSQVSATVTLASSTSGRRGDNNNANETVKLLNLAPIPAGSSLEILSGNKVVMEDNDALKVTSTGNTDVTLSIMEIS